MIKTSLSMNSDYLQVSCQGKELKSVPSNLPPNAKGLDLTHNQLQYLPTGAFSENIRLESLDLSNNQLQKLPEGIFSKNTQLRYLYLSYNQLQDLPEGIFRNNIGLEGLDLCDNNLQKLPSKIFNGPKNLTRLLMAKNQLDDLSPDLFRNMTELTILKLDNNKIRQLHPDQFLGLGNLYDLYLSENKIEELPSGIFKGLRNLLSINLFDNKIRSVSLEHFQDVTRLRFLFLHYNEMYDLPKGIFTNMSNITRVTLDTNLMCCHLEFKQDAGCDFANNDNFANCESMFSRHLAPRKSIWVVGILSLFGAVFVLAWRLFFKSTNVVQAIMLIHLALADGLMGVYLLTIAVKDLLWHGEYYLHDYEWRTGLACQITGAISILSGEVSVMLLLLIAADRMTKIVFPFHCRGLTRKITHVLCLVIWLIGAIIAFLPMLGMQFFNDPESDITYYGRSVVCIPLQLSSYYPPGWEYSVAVFVGLNLAFVVFIVLAYLIIFINRREVRSRSANTSRETSLDKRVLCIVFTNCASWLPIIVVGIRSMVHRSDELPEELSVWLAVFVLPINAAINPVLYTLTTPQVQEILEQKWQQLWSYLMNKFGAPQNHEDEGEVDPDQIVEIEAFDPSGDEDGDGVDNQNQLPHIGPLGVSGGEEGRTQEQYNNRKEDESSDPGPPKAPLATFDEVDDLEDWETPV